MQDLVHPATLRRAVVAALATTLLCLPRLWSWESRPTFITGLVTVLAVCTFVLWGFVFAWSPPSVRPVLRLRREAFPWALATVGGLLGAGLLAGWIDPTLRDLRPEDYARSLNHWVAHWLFTVAMAQLFLCFAPFAFFYRLFHSLPAAVTATVLFGVFLLGLQLQQAEPMGLAFQAFLLGVRVLWGTFAVLLFVRGGPWPVWWWATLLQARELPLLLASG